MGWILLPRNVGGTDQKVYLLFTFHLAVANNCLLLVHINMSMRQTENEIGNNWINGKTKAQTRNVKSFSSGTRIICK